MQENIPGLGRDKAGHWQETLGEVTVSSLLHADFL